MSVAVCCRVLKCIAEWCSVLRPKGSHPSMVCESNVTYMHTGRQTNKKKSIHRYIDAYMYTYLQTHICIHIKTGKLTCIQTCVQEIVEGKKNYQCHGVLVPITNLLFSCIQPMYIYIHTYIHVTAYMYMYVYSYMSHERHCQ